MRGGQPDVFIEMKQLDPGPIDIRLLHESVQKFSLRCGRGGDNACGSTIVDSASNRSRPPASLRHCRVISCPEILSGPAPCFSPRQCERLSHSPSVVDYYKTQKVAKGRLDDTICACQSLLDGQVWAQMFCMRQCRSSLVVGRGSTAQHSFAGLCVPVLLGLAFVRGGGQGTSDRAWMRRAGHCD